MLPYALSNHVFWVTAFSTYVLLFTKIMMMVTRVTFVVPPPQGSSQEVWRRGPRALFLKPKGDGRVPYIPVSLIQKIPNEEVYTPNVQNICSAGVEKPVIIKRCLSPIPLMELCAISLIRHFHHNFEAICANCIRAHMYYFPP